MAKLTGQFTTPSLDAQNNKIHKPLLHAVVFVFTGVTKVTRETDAKGKYSFDLANGEYEVSVYLKGNTEKDRFDMRAGEKFTVTTTTQADALEKWLQVIGTSGKDELATYYENLLAQMQKIANDFKDETQSIGAGKWVKESLIANMMNVGDFGSVGSRSADYGVQIGRDFDKIEILNRVFTLSGGWTNNPYSASSRNFTGVATIVTRLFNAGIVARLDFYENSRHWYRHFNGTEWSNWYEMYGTSNTTVDSNGFIKAASPIIKLFNDRIEHSGFGDNQPIFEKLGEGQYKISNTLGLAQEGWTYEKPRGSDGQPYFRIVVEKLEDGCIVRVHDEYDTVEKAEITDIDGNTRTVDKIVKILGQARDIKEHERWIDLRFHEEPEEHQDEELLTELDDSEM